MFNKRISTIVLLVAFVACSAVCGDDSVLLVDDMVVVLIDEVDVPATENGVIAEISVREGNPVKVGQSLASLDDRKVQLEESLAQTRLAIAKEKSENGLAVDLAEKNLSQQQQLAKQQEIARDVASRKASNEVRVLASQKAAGVAKNELDRATRARQEFIDSVSRSEIDSLRLAYERARLETQQAEFDRQLDGLRAKGEQEAVVGQALSVDRSKIEIERAVADRRVQELELELQGHQSELARLARLKHQIVAPIDGVVVQRFRNKGDWVTAGDPVVRVIRLNRLRAEGFVSSTWIELLRENRAVKLKIQIATDRFIEREGQIVFISPEIDPVNSEVRFWVEFDNPKLDVLPGMHLSLRLDS